MKKYRFCAIALLTTVVSACNTLDSKPVPPPEPIAGKAQEIRRNQTSGLQRMWNETAIVYGSPMNAQEVIEKRAEKAGARYYNVIAINEFSLPGQWRVTATLYR